MAIELFPLITCFGLIAFAVTLRRILTSFDIKLVFHAQLIICCKIRFWLLDSSGLGFSRLGIKHSCLSSLCNFKYHPITGFYCKLYSERTAQETSYSRRSREFHSFQILWVLSWSCLLYLIMNTSSLSGVFLVLYLSNQLKLTHSSYKLSSHLNYISIF